MTIALAKLEETETAARLRMAELDQQETTFGYAWRPGWMYLLGFLWTWALVLGPIVNAATGGAIAMPDLGMLSTITGLYLALYMGGHTVKGVVGPKA
ncbi:hypothetical protein [Mangrovicella endophytica]|uniref:hypothetical protein n=1 Tax=Mangrovicella endophytica TaxID=2066697 RepID=UPI000C9E1F4D|nr:hypothetical protein [Mangrovicella endophytica]